MIASFFQSSKKSQIKFVSSQKTSEQILPASREANAESMLKDGDSAIYVEDQSPGLSKIHIGYVVLAKPGFITIHDNDQGMPGKILGVSKILNGRVDDSSVDLAVALEADRVYYAELISDDGDGVFDALKDHPVNEQNKSVVLMSFQTSTGR